MLLFSTSLAAKPDLDPQAFYKTIVDWNQNSPRKSNIISNLRWNGRFIQRFKEGPLSLEFDALEAQGLYGARFIKEEDGIHWRTDALYFARENRILIQLDRTFSEDIIAFNPGFSTPFLISVMEKHGLFDQKDAIPYADRPWRIGKDQAGILEELYYGPNIPSIPVVLLSSFENGELPVDAEALAWRLKGAAHVLVLDEGGQPAWWRKDYAPQMPSRGMISLFYPKTLSSMQYFRLAEEPSKEALAEKLCTQIFQYNLQLEDASLPAWMLLKARKMEAQRQNESEVPVDLNNDGQILDAYELHEDSEEDASLSWQIRMLQKENHAMQQTLSIPRQPVRSCWSVPPILEDYPGEISEVLLEACALLQAQTDANTRKGKILDALLQENSEILLPGRVYEDEEQEAEPVRQETEQQETKQ